MDGFESDYMGMYKGYEICRTYEFDDRGNKRNIAYVVADDEDYLSEDMRSVKDCKNWIDTYLVR